MNIINEFRQSWKETFKLQRKYYWTTFCISISGMLVGGGIMLLINQPLSTLLNIDPNECIRCQANGNTWALIFFASLPLAIYAGNVLMAGIFGYIMHKRGKFTLEEVQRYALFSRYPRYWFKENT